MHKSGIFAAAAALMTLVATSQSASAQSDRTLTGAAIGAGSGAIIAGPPGAVVGGVVGAIVGGPRIRGRSHKSCWRDGNGVRHCTWR